VTGAAVASWLLVGTPAILLLPGILNAVGAFFWIGAAYADYSAQMVVLSLVLWRCFGQKRYLLLAACFATFSIAAGVRTGVVAAGLGIGLFALLEWRRRALPLLLLVYLGTAVLLFSVPHFREKMFVKGREVGTAQAILSPGKLDRGSINDSGRFTMWSAALGRFFWTDPALGSGLGTTQAWFYSGGYGRLRVEHSEYVRLLCDTGFIGLGLYLAAIVASMTAAARVYWRAPSSACRYAGMLAVISFPVAMVCMAFDNVFNYALPAGQYPLAFTGVALGLAGSAAARQASCAATDDAGPVANRRGRAAPAGARWGRRPLSFDGWRRRDRSPASVSG
jgi:O-antigen ligase